MAITRRDFMKVSGVTVGVMLCPSFIRDAKASVYARQVTLKEGTNSTTICPYCACGCGIMVTVADGKVINAEGDPDHPINEGSLCAKGSALYQIANNDRRLDKVLWRPPYWKGDWIPVPWSFALGRMARKIKATRDRSFTPSRWEKRGFRLTADNRKTKSLAIPSMERLYRHATGRGGKLGALAACLLGSFPGLEESFFARVRAPVLVICGEKDTTSGSPIPLAESIPGARAVVIPGRNHLSAVADPFFKGAVLGFLGQRWTRPRRRSHR